MYFSKSQIIDVVENNPENNITELSNILRITKRTTSPVANILAGRGCLKKLHASDDSTVVRLQLTEKGEGAWKGFAKQAKEFTSVQWSTFNIVIAKLETFVDNKLKKGT